MAHSHTISLLSISNQKQFEFDVVKRKSRKKLGFVRFVTIFKSLLCTAFGVTMCISVVANPIYERLAYSDPYSFQDRKANNIYQQEINRKKIALN